MADRNVLKENEIYLVSDENGDLASHNSEGHGLYWRDTRYLSLYELWIDGTKPTLLSSAGEHSFMNNFQFANLPLTTANGTTIGPRTLSIRRNRFIHLGLHERIGFFNYNRFSVTLKVTLLVGSDFRDMFDVRGYTVRDAHGTIERPEHNQNRLTLRYLGLDGVHRSTEVVCDPPPRTIDLANVDLPQRLERRVLPGLSGHGDPRTEYSVTPPTAELHFELTVPAKQHRSITVHVMPRVEAARPQSRDGHLSLDQQFVQIRDSYARWDAESTHIETDDEILNAVIRRAQHDLRLLTDLLPSGYVPSAGIPWFSVPFGRDSLITSIQTLMLRPDIAYGTLRFLAANQGREVNDWRDEEPGKILHEVRAGEVATLNQVPHTPYYGSVDSTPLFLMSVGRVLDWTDDLELARELRPHVEAALSWIETFGDADGDGYVEYSSRSPNGIRNQGWKDSIDAIAHRDGRPIEPPIALSEVQGYVFEAWLQAANYYRRLGAPELAESYVKRASLLQERFAQDFWLSVEQYPAIALGPDKQAVAAVASNPAHCLWTGLLVGDLADRTADRLIADDMDCGWGIRTLSSREPMFNPMSYHNGSVWPHDNAIIVAGLKRLGRDAEAARVAGAIFEAAQRFPLYRLPELFCGFTRDRRYFSIPAQYPVSCSPQAWAAGAIFSLIQSVLGLRVDAGEQRIELRPQLPRRLTRIRVERMQAGGRRVSFEVSQQRDRVHLEVLDSGGLEVSLQPTT